MLIIEGFNLRTLVNEFMLYALTVVCVLVGLSGVNGLALTEGALFLPPPRANGEALVGLRSMPVTALGIDSMVQSLAARQFVVVPNFLVPEDIDDLFMDVEQRYVSNELHEGGVKGSRLDATIRNTLVDWMSSSLPHTTVESHFLQYMDVFRGQLALSLSLDLCSEDTEALYVRYPVGGFYKAHSDSHYPGPDISAQDSERRLSFILYVNVNDWQPNQEGCLRLWPGTPESIDLPPLPGCLILFNSRDLYHEVMKTEVVRRAVVGWFRMRSEPPRVI